MDIQIVEAKLTTALEVLRQLPEFDPLLDNDYYIEKVKSREHLILIAKVNSSVIGCKVGYDKFKDGSFYSWLGGVIPSARKAGIAKLLADHQEQWAKSKGYNAIKFKTLNRHKHMLLFAIKNGFEIYNIKPKDELENYRIEMIKDLL